MHTSLLRRKFASLSFRAKKRETSSTSTGPTTTELEPIAISTRAPRLLQSNDPPTIEEREAVLEHIEAIRAELRSLSAEPEGNMTRHKRVKAKWKGGAVHVPNSFTCTSISCMASEGSQTKFSRPYFITSFKLHLNGIAPCTASYVPATDGDKYPLCPLVYGAYFQI